MHYPVGHHADSVTCARLHVSGRPAPKGSRVMGVRRDGSRYTREASRHAAPWTNAVATQAFVTKTPTVAPPYSVEITFFFFAPQRSKYGYPVTGDLDKCVRATLDGLVRGGVLSDDRHVTELMATSEFADHQGALITIAHDERYP